VPICTLGLPWTWKPHAPPKRWCDLHYMMSHPRRQQLTSALAYGWWRTHKAKCSTMCWLLTHKQPAKRAGVVQIKLRNRLLLNLQLNCRSGNMITVILKRLLLSPRPYALTGLNPQSTVVTSIYAIYFNIKNCILPTTCICIFRVVLIINSDCSPNSINRLGSVVEM
jgi:hypothetical protein